MIGKLTRIGLVLSTFLLSDLAFGQVKVGDNPTQINVNAIMELESANKGVLLPRIALTSTSSPSPMSAFVAGMVVYNTATAGDVVPGFYVSNGSSWTKIDNQSGTTYTGSTSVLLNGTSFERAALTGDVTATQNSNTLTIANDAVTYSKMQNVSTNNVILGRATSGSGDVEEITLGTGLTLTGTTLTANGDLRLVNTSSHITQDAGVGSNGTSAGAVQSVMIGQGAGNSNSGQRNIFIGHEAGNANTSATNLVFMGYQAGKSNTTGARNTFVGNLAGTGNTTANGNTGFGFEALKTNSTGNNNTAFGTFTLTNNTLYSNTAIGFNALNTNNGFSNTVVGAAAMESETTGNHNTVIGASAGWRISGNENVIVGSGTGWNLTTGSKNILIGRNITAPMATGSNQLSIGNLIYGTNVDGDGSTISTGNIGIGVAAPSQKLEVAGAIRFSGALMPNNTAGTAGQVLTSAGAGAVPTWTTIPTATTYTGSTSVALNGTSFERAALTGDVTAAQNSNALTIANDAVTSAKILDGTIATADVANSAVTYAKIQNVSANNRILGRATTGAGTVEEITLGSGLTLTGTTLSASGDLRLVNTTSHITQDAGVGSNGTSAGAGEVIAIGAGAGNANSAAGSVFIGHQAGNSNSNGSGNSFVGYQSGRLHTTGPMNTYFGYQAGENSTNGNDNTYMGYRAGRNSGNGVFWNTYVGSKAGEANTSGVANAAFGAEALKSNNGNGNAAFGAGALSANTSGGENAVFGRGALPNNTTGSTNAVLGSVALYWSSTGSNNVAVGGGSGYQTTTGSNNTFIGYNSGSNKPSGSGNIVIGNSAMAPSITASNQLSIGNLIYGTDLDGTGATISTGNIGIGVTAPSQKLEVGGAIRFSGALMPNNTAGTAGQVLTSAGAGAVPTWTTLPTATTYNGSTSVALNGTSFERAALTGDVTAAQNSNALTIANDAVTTSKIINGAITAAKLNQMSAATGQVLKWNGTSWAPAADDNTIADGSETIVTAGSGITISGAGTTASPYVINANSSVATVTADYTATSANNTILCNVPGAGMTLTLPSASANTGKVIVIRKIDNDRDVLTFSPALNYSTSQTISTLNFVKTITVQSNGTAWWVISE